MFIKTFHSWGSMSWLLFPFILSMKTMSVPLTIILSNMTCHAMMWFQAIPNTKVHVWCFRKSFSPNATLILLINIGQWIIQWIQIISIQISAETLWQVITRIWITALLLLLLFVLLVLLALLVLVLFFPEAIVSNRALTVEPGTPVWENHLLLKNER